MRIASLPMYDADPEAVAAWWEAISCALRARGSVGAPATFVNPGELDAHWRDPRLLLSQTCGYPLMTSLLPHVQVVGAFRYTAPGCAGIAYRSDLLARAGDADTIEGFCGRTAAVNSPDSHSGCNALQALVAPLARHGAFFSRLVVTGSHRRSLAAVQSGVADVAAIDCVCLAGFRRHDPELLRGLRVIGSTAPAPGLPLITSGTTTAAELAALREALQAVCSDAALADVRAALFIGGFEAVPAETWRPIEEIRRFAAERLRATLA